MITEEEFDKLIGNVVRFRYRNGRECTGLIDGKWEPISSHYYSLNHGLNKNDVIEAVSREEITSAEILPKVEALIWRIENDI